MGKKVMEQIFSDAINHHHFNGTVATALGQQIQDYLIAAIQICGSDLDIIPVH
jgi:hypothetical protein